MSHVRFERDEVALGASTTANRKGDGLQSKKKARTEDVGIEGREKAQKVGGPDSKTFRRKFIVDDDDDDDDDDADEVVEGDGSEQGGVQVKANLNDVFGEGVKANSEGKASSQDQPTIAGETPIHHGTGIADLKGNLQVLSGSDGGSVVRGADGDIHVQRNSCTGWNARRESGFVHSVPNQEHDKVVPEGDEMDGPVSVREALTDLSVDIDEDNHKGSAHLSLVWLKVDEMGLWWPGKLVTEAEVPADFHKLLALSEGVKKRVVSLFNPAKEFEPYRAVTRSDIRPFKQYYESFKNIHPHPRFKWAVQEAYRLFCNYSQTGTANTDQQTNCTNEEKLISIESNEGACQEKVNGDAQSNQIKPEVEDPQILEDNIQCGQSHADIHVRRIDTDEIVQAGSEVPRGSATIPDATIGSSASKRRDEESSSFKTSDSEECKGMHSKKKKLDARDQANAPLEKLVVDLEISPSHRLILYDPSSKELHFQDGSVLKADPESLGKLLNKSFTGLILHHCIYKAGKDDIRKRFPKHARSSNGLEFDALDQTTEFAKRLRDTWAREYKDESIPKFLKTRFVAGCIMEERGEAVNWAAELTHDINLELKDVYSQKRKELSPPIYRLINCILSLLPQQVTLTENCISSRLLDASRSSLAEPERLNTDDNPEPPENASRLYAGEGWNAQEEEVSDILLRTVLTKEALCSKCGLKWRDHVVEIICGVRNDGSTILINKLDLSDTVEKEILASTDSEKPQINQHSLYGKRFQIYQNIPSNSCGERSPQRFRSEMEHYYEMPDGSTSADSVLKHTLSKNSHQEYLVHWKSCSHGQGEWVSEEDLEKWAPKELAFFKKLVSQGQVSMLGMGQRVRKRVRCDEDADRFAPLRDVDENQRKLQRQRLSSAGDLEVVHGEDGGLTSSAQICYLQFNASPPSDLPPNSHTTIFSNTSLPASHIDTQLTATQAFLPSAMSRAMPKATMQEQTTTSQVNTTKDLSTMNNLHQNSHHHGCKSSLGSDGTCVPKSNGVQPDSPAMVHSVASSSNPGVASDLVAVDTINAGLDCTETGKENTYTAWMIDILAKLCLTLKLPKSVENHVQDLFKHIMRTSKNLRKRRKRHEVIAIELAMIWLAADQLCYALDKSTTIDEAEVALNVHYDNRSQLEHALYTKVQGLCSNFKKAPSLPTVSPTTPRAIPVPPAIALKSGVSMSNTSLSRETEPPSKHDPTKAKRDQEAPCDTSQTLPGVIPEVGVQADYPISTPASSSPAVLACPSKLKSITSVPHTSSRIHPDPSHRHEPTEASQEQEALTDASHRLSEGTPEAILQTNYPISNIFPSSLSVLGIRSAVKPSNSAPKTSSRINSELSPQIEPTMARQEQELPKNASHRIHEGTPEGGLVTDHSCSLVSGGSVPVPLPLKSTGIVKEQELSRNRSETDFGEKNPVSVSKISLETLLAQKVPSDPYTPYTLTSSMSLVANGLGWVIQGAFLQVRSTVECEPCLEVVAQAVELFPCPQIVVCDAATEKKGLARTGSSEAEPPVQTQSVPTPEDPVLARLYAQLAEQLSEDREQVIRAQMKEFEEIDLKLDQETRRLKQQFNRDCLKLRSTNGDPEPWIATVKVVFETNLKELVQRAIRERRGIKARQRKDRDKLSELYKTVTGELGKPDLLKVEWEYNSIKKYYSKFLNHTQVQQPVEEPIHNNQINDRRSTQDPPTAQAPSSSRIPQINRRSAEGQQSQQSVQAPSPSIPSSGVLPQQLQSHAVPPGSSHGINHGVDAQRHSQAMSRITTPQATTQPPAVQIPRNHSSGMTPVASVSNASILPAPLVEPASGAIYEYIDVLVREKAKLNKTLERVKVIFESESLRIKAEYDKEAETLYKKYEALLVEEHQDFAKKHQHIQQKIAKVEWNRQLAEALNLREELAYRAATGIASGQILSTSMQTTPHQPAGQQSRPTFSNAFSPSGANAGSIYSMGMLSTCLTTTALGYQPPPRNPLHLRTEQPQQPLPQSGHDLVLQRRTMPPHTLAQPSQQNPSISVPPQDTTTVTVQSTEAHRNTSSLRLPIYTGAVSNVPVPLPPDPILGIIQNSVIPSLSFMPTRLVVPEVGEQSMLENVVPEVVIGADGTRAAQMGYCQNTDTRAQVASSLLRPTGLIVLTESDED